MKKKINKKLLARIGAVLACILLVGALAIPCFADDNAGASYNVQDVKNSFYNRYGLTESDPLYSLMESDYWDGAVNRFLLQFTIQNSPWYVENLELLTFDFVGNQSARIFVRDHTNNGLVQFSEGYWSTNYRSDGTDRILFLKFNEFLDGAHRVALQIRIVVDSNTSEISGTTITSDYYSLSSDPTRLSIGCIASEFTALPLHYAKACGFLNFKVAADFWTFEDAFSEGLKFGYDFGYQAGELAGYQRGFEDGISGVVVDSASYGNVLDEFQKTLDPRSDTSSYGDILSYYNGFGDSRFLNVKTLVSGTANVQYNANYLDSLKLLNSMNDGTIKSTIALDYYSVTLSSNSGLESVMGAGYVEFIQIANGSYESVVAISFYEGSESVPQAKFLYDVVAHSAGQDVTLNSVFIDGETYEPRTIGDIEVAFTVHNLATQDMLPTICALLFLDDITYYEDVIYSPFAFSQGYTVSYNLGYDDGNRYGYQNGYDEGYSKGKEEGTGGADYDTAFKDGYNEAVRQIDSGEFGENFLGNIFSAPMDALNGFVIVSTPSGIDITLGGVLSACVALGVFLAFLKILRGA